MTKAVKIKTGILCGRNCRKLSYISEVIAVIEENGAELVKIGTVNKKDTKRCGLEEVQRGLK